MRPIGNCYMEALALVGELSHELPPVSEAVVPYHDGVAGYVPEQVAEEGHDICRANAQLSAETRLSVLISMTTGNWS